MVDLTSVILPLRSSAWETGVGNLPARKRDWSAFWPESKPKFKKEERFLTLGETGAEQTGDLLDQGVGSDEGIVLASKLLDELLVLVELLEIIGAHGVDTAVLGTVDIVLVTENADAHVRAGNSGQADGARETLVTLGVIVLEANLEPVQLPSCQYLCSIARFFSSSAQVVVASREGRWW